MLITFMTASLCGRLLSDARQKPYIRSIAGSLLSQYAHQNVKRTSTRVVGIASNVLKYNSNVIIKKLALLAIERG